jgi:hypothetical protein
MTKILAYNDQNGDFCLTIPTKEFLGSSEELVNFVGVQGSYLLLDSSEIPNHPEFSKAFRLGANSVEIDLEQAKNIWKDKWREARKPLLASLDVEFMKAVETGNSTKQAEIASKKQALRDVTSTPIPGTTPEEIKAVWPEILN